MYFSIRKFLNRPILKEISWYMIGQGGVQVFTFLGVIVTARYLGPINLGLYSFVQNYLSLFVSLLGSVDFYFTWQLVRSDNKLHEIKRSIGYKLYITTFISLLGIVCAMSFLPRDVAILATVLFVPLILSSASNFYSYAIVNRQATIFATAQIIASLSLLLIKCVLVYIKAPLLFFVATNAFESVFLVLIIGFYYFSKKDIRKQMSEAPLPSFFDTLHFLYSIKLIVVVIVFWQLILRVDQFIIAAMTNAYNLGIYAAATRISEISNFFGSIMYTTLISRVPFFTEKNDSLSNYRRKKVFFVYFLVGMFFTVSIIVAAPIIIHLLYGVKFTEAIPVLRSYALSIPGMFLCLHYSAIYGSSGKHAYQAIIFFLGIILNVALIYIFMPVFGLVGAALATSVTYSLIAISFYIHTK